METRCSVAGGREGDGRMQVVYHMYQKSESMMHALTTASVVRIHAVV